MMFSTRCVSSLTWFATVLAENPLSAEVALSILILGESLSYVKTKLIDEIYGGMLRQIGILEWKHRNDYTVEETDMASLFVNIQRLRKNSLIYEPDM